MYSLRVCIDAAMVILHYPSQIDKHIRLGGALCEYQYFLVKTEEVTEDIVGTESTYIKKTIAAL